MAQSNAIVSLATRASSYAAYLFAFCFILNRFGLVFCSFTFLGCSNSCVHGFDYV